MTSSQPVVTPNALIFTPDNKNCYAYSGLITSTSNETTALDFTTDSEYLVGEFQVNAGYDDDNATEAATATVAQIQFNDQGLVLIGCGGATPDRRPSSIQQKIIIPPFTHVKCLMRSETEADKYISMTFTGQAIGKKDVGYQ
jgi:hypothetical protein